jgi:hypothetical protein
MTRNDGSEEQLVVVADGAIGDCVAFCVEFVVRGDGVRSSATVQVRFVRALFARNDLCHVGVEEDHETRNDSRTLVER